MRRVQRKEVVGKRAPRSIALCGAQTSIGGSGEEIQEGREQLAA